MWKFYYQIIKIRKTIIKIKILNYNIVYCIICVITQYFVKNISSFQFQLLPHFAILWSKPFYVLIRPDHQGWNYKAQGPCQLKCLILGENQGFSGRERCVSKTCLHYEAWGHKARGPCSWASAAGGLFPPGFLYIDRGLKVLFFGLFCYFLVFFPLPPTPLKEAE